MILTAEERSGRKLADDEGTEAGRIAKLVMLCRRREADIGYNISEIATLKRKLAAVRTRLLRLSVSVH